MIPIPVGVLFHCRLKAYRGISAADKNLKLMRNNYVVVVKFPDRKRLRLMNHSKFRYPELVVEYFHDVILSPLRTSSVNRLRRLKLEEKNGKCAVIHFPESPSIETRLQMRKTLGLDVNENARSK